MQTITIHPMRVLFLLLLCTASISAATNRNPNWVRTTTYNGPGKVGIHSVTDLTRAEIAVTFYDGMGRRIQSQVLLNTQQGKGIISGGYPDAVGRDSIQVKPFVAETEGFLKQMDGANLITLANAYYDGSAPFRPDAQGFAFSETRYWPDGSVQSAGRPGKPFSFDPEGKTGKTWHFGVNPLKEGLPTPLDDLNVDEHGFLHMYLLSDQFLDFFMTTKPVIQIITYAELPSKPAKGERYIVTDDMNQIYEYNGQTWDKTYPFAGMYCQIISQSYCKAIYNYTEWRTDLRPDNHFLTISRDENGHFTQILKDKFGNTIRTWSCVSDNETDRIISGAQYDIQGNITAELPPDPSQPAPTSDPLRMSSYKYNTMGQLIQKRTPDTYTTEYRYDKTGNLRFVKDSLHRHREIISGEQKEYFLAYDYDQYNRQTVTKEVAVEWSGTGPRSFDLPDEALPANSLISKKIENIYDTITQQQLAQYDPDREAPLLEKITAELTNTNGRLAGVVAYHKDWKRVIDLFSYDQKGRTRRKYKLIPFTPAQKDSIAYSATGDIIEEYHFRDYDLFSQSWIMSLKKEYIYDADNRLVAFKANNKKIADYTYTENGIMNRKSYCNTYGDAPLEQFSYEYGISGWLEHISSTINPSLFTEQLYYHENSDPGFPQPYTPKYDGTISGIYMSGLLGSSENYFNRITCSYDHINRLMSTSWDGEHNGTPSYDDEQFIYDNIGRIQKKKESRFILDNYAYTAHKNQLAYIPGSAMDQTADGQPNYLYDLNGNMVLDRSKNMVVEYDWRNMPVFFTMYSTIPLADKDGDPYTWQTLHELNYQDGVEKLAEVEMVYDASGNRVQKLQY